MPDPVVRNPPRRTLELWRGSTFKHEVVYYAGPTEDSGVQNLTDWNAELFIKVAPFASTDDPVVIAASPTEITMGSDGVIAIALEPSVTNAVEWDTAMYELVLISPSATRTIIARGTVLARGV